MLNVPDLRPDPRAKAGAEVFALALDAADLGLGAQPAADVLAVNRVGFMGGVERVLLVAAEAMAERGWTTALACPPGDLADTARTNGMPLYVTDLGPMSAADMGSTPGAWLRQGARARRGGQALLDVARLAQGRIIHVHHPAVAVQARMAARRLKSSMIWHVHETAPMSATYRALGFLAARSCDLFICVSKASRDMVRELGAPEERIRLVYNAAEARFFAPTEIDREPWPQGPHIGQFAVLEPRKGHADLIRALAMISSSWPTAQLWLVGGVSFERHADYQGALERLAEGLGVADRVHFTGRRTDVPQLMARMDVIVSASVCSESLPTALIEACAMGRSTIGTDVGGTSEIIRHCQNGLLVRPAAPRELANAIELALSPAGEVLARRARADARLRFSPARFAADLEGCYRGLVEQGQEHRP